MPWAVCCLILLKDFPGGLARYIYSKTIHIYYVRLLCFSSFLIWSTFSLPSWSWVNGSRYFIFSPLLSRIATRLVNSPHLVIFFILYRQRTITAAILGPSFFFYQNLAPWKAGFNGVFDVRNGNASRLRYEGLPCIEEGNRTGRWKCWTSKGNQVGILGTNEIQKSQNYDCYCFLECVSSFSDPIIEFKITYRSPDLFKEPGTQQCYYFCLTEISMPFRLNEGQEMVLIFDLSLCSGLGMSVSKFSRELMYIEQVRMRWWPFCRYRLQQSVSQWLLMESGPSHVRFCSSIVFGGCSVSHFLISCFLSVGRWFGFSCLSCGTF